MYKTNPIVDGRLLDGAFNYYANHVMLEFCSGKQRLFFGIYWNQNGSR